MPFPLLFRPLLTALALMPLAALTGIDAPAAHAVVRTYYVAPTGSDANPGTLARPFRTVQHAHNRATPGDTIYLRGGVYYVDGWNNGRGVWIYRSGTAGAPIKLWAYPGERPIIDGARWTAPGERFLLQISADWWHIRGLELRHLAQTGAAVPTMGLSCWDCNHNRLEQLDAHHIQGTGLAIGNVSSGNLLVNSDSHENFDPLTPGSPGGNADGIDISFLQPGTSGNSVRGCRTWYNSDDGIDLWESESAVVVAGNWSFLNGYRPGTRIAAGDGNGFKLGRSFRRPKHDVRNNLSFFNRSYGFDENVGSGGIVLRNNTAFNNTAGAYRIVTNVAYVWRNNLAVPKVVNIPAAPDDAVNSWSLPVTATTADFRSVSSAGVTGKRAATGALPTLPFLRLAAGSDLINKGVPVGIPFRGSAPDLGAFESP